MENNKVFPQFIIVADVLNVFESDNHAKNVDVLVQAEVKRITELFKL